MHSSQPNKRQVLVGLGNPGGEYEKTRHNAGFELVDWMIEQLIPVTETRKVFRKFDAEIAMTTQHILVKPQTFMNNSGVPVRQVLNFYGDFKRFPREALQHLFVAHDDLDIPLGSFKVQFGKGPKIHNGLLSIYKHLGSDQFWHVRLGVDNRAGDRSLPGHAYVLQKFQPREQQTFETTLAEVSQHLQTKWTQDE